LAQLRGAGQQSQFSKNDWPNFGEQVRRLEYQALNRPPNRGNSTFAKEAFEAFGFEGFYIACKRVAHHLIERSSYQALLLLLKGGEVFFRA